jgi:hypothetical protein
MDKNKIRVRPLTVDNVKQAMHPYPEDQLHTTSQILQMFDAAPKLERIIWSILKREHLRRKKEAEKQVQLVQGRALTQTELNVDAEIASKLDAEAQLSDMGPRPPESIVELHKLKVIVGICSRCGNTLVGTRIGTCKELKKQPIFYKECVGCSYYAEVFKSDNNYYEVEGG